VKGGGKLIVKGLPVPMTPRQRDVYLYIRFFWKKFGYSPSCLDIAEGLDLKSKNNILRIVNRLVSLGIIDKEKNKKRTMKPSGVRYDRLC
jgi:SOS-response transcriptional repressor LexA